MKTHLFTRLYLIALFALTPALAQEAAERALAGETEPAASDLQSVVSAARILGNIPDGTPPPPEAPRPEFVVAKGEVLNRTTHEQGGRIITIRKIKPIDLPPPPAPLEPPAANLEGDFSQRLSEYRDTHPRSGLLFLGATVFRSKDSPPRTLVRYWPEGKGEDVTFWSSADFAIIAGGIQSFADTTGQTHHIFMGWGNVDIDRMTDLLASKGREYNVPEMPEFPAGKATFQFVGEQPTAEHLVAIQSLHDLYNSEHDRLLKAYEGREKARVEQEEYLKANPPKPKDITLNYWRTTKPATIKKGGATR